MFEQEYIFFSINIDSIHLQTLRRVWTMNMKEDNQWDKARKLYDEKSHYQIVHYNRGRRGQSKCDFILKLVASPEKLILRRP